MAECYEHPVANPVAGCNACLMRAIDAQMAHDLRESRNHPQACREPECHLCSLRDCPHKDPLHHHHDGCPSCFHE